VVQFMAEAEDFCPLQIGSGPNQPPVQLIPQAVALCVKQLGNDADLHIGLRIRICAAVPSLPQVP